LVASCARLGREAAGVHEPDVQAAGLELADALLRQPNGAEGLGASRELVRAGLRSAAAANRLRAVQVALRPGMDLLDQVVGLLTDPAAEVRRAAMLAVGPAEQVIDDEALLASLHDPDPEVRRLCEAALRGRRLLPEHIHLGRLLTDPNPVVRLKVLDDLYKVPDLDPGIWLRRLSHDSSPAVRVAAVRAMTQQNQIDLSDRIDQMARSDPSPTVCQLAQFYLRSLKTPAGPGTGAITDPAR
jgi:HEAT repeat protein